VTRAAGLHPRRISRDEHERWLAARIDSPASRVLIAEEAGRPVGQFRLERDEDGQVEIGILTAPEARGRGVGRRLLRAGIAWARADAALAPAGFVALVRPENEPSLALFRGAGFAEVGRMTVEGVECVRFALGPAGTGGGPG
jgi:RimJ/RimL family protein N-acetyltransferase